MDFFVILGVLLAVGLIIGVPCYLVLGGSAGRSWKGIKENEKWKRDQEEQSRRK